MYRGERREDLCPGEKDLVLCADAGYDAARSAGIHADLVIGDFDSMPVNHVSDTPYIQLPTHKDDTDTRVCLEEGRKRGYRIFRIFGGLGGRMDHTLANLQCLAECAQRGEDAMLLDAGNTITVLRPGSYSFSSDFSCYLSLLAFSDAVKDICLQGTEWELEHAELRNTYPLGTSNEMRRPIWNLSFAEGLLAVLLCRKEKHE